jgi:hypothetical protein
MSEETDSSTEPVYVRLLGEGTLAYRPAVAVMKGPGVALLAAPEDYDPDDEDWEFGPGTMVRVEEKTLDGHQVLVAVSLAK